MAGGNSPPPLEGGGWGGWCQGRTEASREPTTPPNPLPQGEGEKFTRRSRLILMRMGQRPVVGLGREAGQVGEAPACLGGGAAFRVAWVALGCRLAHGGTV